MADFCRRSIVVVLMLLVISSTSRGQQINEAMQLYFKDVRVGKYPAVPKILVISENAKVILPALASYLTDSLAEVRSKAYTITSLSGNSARQSHLRELAVAYLVSGTRDVDGGNAGISLDYLASFLKEDFNSTSKDSVRSLFRKKAQHFEKVIKLCGFLELVDLKEEIRPYTQAGNSQSLRWAALVSLARMGDGAAISEVDRRARKLPVNDDVIYSIFPDLAYTRNRQLIGYMVEILQRDDATCMSADAERSVQIPCGYRVMEQLAPVVKGYPLSLDASGDVKTNDYVAALKTVREWFAKHQNYEIIKDKY